jgi:hypothetical protein
MEELLLPISGMFWQLDLLSFYPYFIYENNVREEVAVVMVDLVEETDVLVVVKVLALVLGLVDLVGELVDQKKNILQLF